MSKPEIFLLFLLEFPNQFSSLQFLLQVYSRSSVLGSGSSINSYSTNIIFMTMLYILFRSLKSAMPGKATSCHIPLTDAFPIGNEDYQ